MKDSLKILLLLACTMASSWYAFSADNALPSPVSHGALESDGREWVDAGTRVEGAAILKKLPIGYTDQSGMVQMRDGVKLATDIFLPPGGKPTCVILVRTPYGRMRGVDTAMLVEKQFVFVTQDPRGSGNSGGEIQDPINNVSEIQDSYDTLDWIAKQPWCNGRIGMCGGSGNGMIAAMAYLCKHPNLVVVSPRNSAGNTALYWSFENGVRRWMYCWLTFRGAKIKPWPRPTLYEQFDPVKWQKILDEAAKDNKTVYLGDDGWYNIFGDSALDFYAQFAHTGHVQMWVDTREHGSLPAQAVKLKINWSRDIPAQVRFLDVLEGTQSVSKSSLTYAVIGDYTDAKAPGNTYKTSAVWPPKHTPMSMYLTQDGTLSKEAPRQAQAAVSYTYDPKDPAPTLGGGFSYSPEDANGPVDQRPLTKRKDVLKFVSDTLTEPLEIAGKLKAELYISSDVADTAFMLKLVDIYPDGQEILLREAAVLARYRDGVAHNPVPMKAGEIYQLTFPCNSIAAAFNKGHRIGIFVTSSSTPAYEVHPNTWEPVFSIEQAVLAHQTIFCSSTHASRVILPVISEE